MLVIAVSRGQFGQRMVDAGTQFECPTEHLALSMRGPAGEALGWMEPANIADYPQARALIAKFRACKPAFG
jgi:hypothetical protein